MPKVKKTPPGAPTIAKHDQQTRTDFGECFTKLAGFMQLFARNDIRYLVTHLELTHEFVLTFDVPNGFAARELCPALFPERKNNKGYFGDSVYFRYISAAHITARGFVGASIQT